MFYQAVKLMDIGLEMFVMMQVHGFFIDKGFQTVIGIGKRGIDKRIAEVHRTFTVSFLLSYSPKGELVILKGSLKKNIRQKINKYRKYRSEKTRQKPGFLKCGQRDSNPHEVTPGRF